MRNVLVLASASLLSACAVQGNSITQDLDKTHVDFASDDFSQLYREQYLQFLKTYSLTKGKVTATNSIADGKLITTYSFASSAELSASDVGALQEFVKTGFSYVDGKCADYFGLLHKFYRRKREAVSNVNLFTGLASGLAAAAKAKAGEIAALAVTGSGAAALVDNNGSSLLFELDPSNTQGLVNRALLSYRTQAARQSIDTFSDAMTAVQGYAGICTPVQIERLINEAVQSKEPTPADPAGANGTSSAALASVVLSSIFGTNVTLNDNQTAALYWLFKLPDAKDDKTQVHAIRELLGDAAVHVLQDGDDRLRSMEADTAKQARVGAMLDLLSQTDPSLRKRAETMQKSVIAAASSPAPAPSPPPVPAPPSPPVEPPAAAPAEAPASAPVQAPAPTLGSKLRGFLPSQIRAIR